MVDNSTRLNGRRIKDATVKIAKVDFVIDDDTMATAAATNVPSSESVVAYVASQLSGLPAAYHPKGAISLSGNPNYPAATAGDVYYVSVIGKIGGASGRVIDTVNQLIVCDITNGGGDQATVGADFTILPNKDGVVTSSSSAVTDSDIVVLDGTSGKIVKTSGVSISSLTPHTFANESPTLTGGQTDFVLAHTPIANSQIVSLNGQLMRVGVNNDYTLTSDTISFVNDTLEGTDNVNFIYEY